VCVFKRVCVCVCVLACVRVCVRVWMGACACAVKFSLSRYIMLYSVDPNLDVCMFVCVCARTRQTLHYLEEPESQRAREPENQRTREPESQIAR
jgi:hypothetical protein